MNEIIKNIPPEQQLSDLLSELPRELALRQKKRFEEAENKEVILKDIQEIIQERKEEISSPFSHMEEKKVFNENLTEEERYNFNKKITKITEEALSGDLNTLGTGKSATVATSQIDSHFCFKLIYNPKEYLKGNSIKKEIDFLEEIIKINKTKVKVPSPYYYEMSKKIHLFVMEKMEAVTIGEVLRGEKNIPENFNLQVFFDELSLFLENIHEEGIYHRDFHEDNVMIDNETGLPCVIDPGYAIRNYSNDEVEIYKKKDEVFMTKDNYPRDESELLRHKNNLNIFLKKGE